MPDLPPTAAPPPGNFEARTGRYAGTLLLRLTGEFDLSNIGRVEVALERGLTPDTRLVLFDLADVTFLDLAGLALLLRANERARHEAFEVQVVVPTGNARRVFSLTRAGTELTMLDAVPDRFRD